MTNNFFNKVNEISDELTKSEVDLVDYIIKNKNEVVNYNITELAEKTKLSIATISRFSRKLGYKNFQRLKTDMNMLFAEEKLIFNNTSNDFDTTLLNGVIYHNINYLDKSVRLINSEQVYRACLTLNDSNRFFIFGKDSSDLYCSYLFENLSQTNLVGNFSTNQSTQIRECKKLTRNDCAIILDYDESDNNNLMAILKILKINKVPVILFTNKSFNYLERNSDITLFTSPFVNNDLLPIKSNYFVIFDYFYLYYLNTFENNKNFSKED